MHRKWTRDELAPILFTSRDYTILERLVQREMRCGSESVLKPKKQRGDDMSNWTAERHADAKGYAQEHADDVPGPGYYWVDAIAEIERLQAECQYLASSISVCQAGIANNAEREAKRGNFLAESALLLAHKIIENQMAIRPSC